ncbi:MAG TPA: hypothetical protein PLL07_01390, partial [Nitrosomonas sp.]|nr:hypothetical protein [Nitrosomonas sp.]
MRLVFKDFFRYCSTIIIVFNLSWIISACQTFDQSSQQSRFIENPAAIGSQFPYLSSLPDGSMLMSWIEGKGNHQVLKFAIYRQDR